MNTCNGKLTTRLLGAACVMPIAKVLNLWDRTLGICIMVLIAIMGLIMMACCNNIATYCAAQVRILPLPHPLHFNTANPVYSLPRHSTRSDSPVQFSQST
jgi:hypothetical protein